jgi:hypothetical protein
MTLNFSDQNAEMFRRMKKFVFSTLCLLFVYTLSAHAQITGVNALKKVAEAINNSIETAVYKVSVVEKLPNNSLAEIIPELKNGDITVNIIITKEGAKNPVFVTEKIINALQITNAVNVLELDLTRSSSADARDIYWSINEWLENNWNAQAGDISAKRLIAQLELRGLDNAETFLNSKILQKELGVPDGSDFKAEIEARKKQASAQLAALVKEEKIQADAAKKAFEARKATFAPVFETQPEKLNDMVAKGDRKGARKLIENYLPWEMMKPSERFVWAQWLNAIENPDPARARLLFRGMDGDVIMRTKDGKPFSMSTVLAKNQGNYTRRLRSIETSRAKLLAEWPYKASSANLSSLMLIHSDDPIASQFISLTPDGFIASIFGIEKLAAIKIDERRLFPNVFSEFPDELEILTPLIIFPDEVVLYQEVPAGEKVAMEAFVEELKKRMDKSELEKLSDPGAFFSKLAKQQRQALFGSIPPKGLASANCVSDILKALTGFTQTAQ